MERPRLIEFPRIGTSEIGYLSVGAYGESIPFEIRRVFWTYYTPESIIRGRHAHHKTEQVLIAVAGRIVVTTESPGIGIEIFVLDAPDKGVYIPPYIWHTMQFSHTAVQISIASSEYSESDYIRDYNEFKSITGGSQ